MEDELKGMEIYILAIRESLLVAVKQYLMMKKMSTSTEIGRSKQRLENVRSRLLTELQGMPVDYQILLQSVVSDLGL